MIFNEACFDMTSCRYNVTQQCISRYFGNHQVPKLVDKCVGEHGYVCSWLDYRLKSKRFDYFRDSFECN